jgi:hypothetical protein
MHTIGSRILTVAITVAAVLALLLLTGITETRSAPQIDVAVTILGLGARLGLPARTDTVMDAVPERDAGVGSRERSQSPARRRPPCRRHRQRRQEQLRADLSDSLLAAVDPDVARSAAERIGLAPRPPPRSHLTQRPP